MNSYGIYRRAIVKLENAKKAIKYSGNESEMYYECDKSGEYGSDISQLGRVLFLARKVFESDFRLNFNGNACLVVYVERGFLNLQAANERFVLGCGEVAIMNETPCTLIQQNGRGLDLVILWCAGQFTESACALIKNKKTRLYENEWVTQHFEALARLCKDPSPSAELCCFSTLSALFSDILIDSEKSVDALGKNIPQHILRCSEMIDNEYGRDISIDELAQTSGLSKAQLHRAFLKYVGMTPYEYLTEKRMKIARTLLISSEHKIKHIASAVGYRSVSNFIKHFKRHHLQTPEQYRQKYIGRSAERQA